MMGSSETSQTSDREEKRDRHVGAPGENQDGAENKARIYLLLISS